MHDIQPVDVLLVEDNPADAELTMSSLREQHLCNVIEWVQDGAAALDYLRGEGIYSGRDPQLPKLVLLDIKLPKVDGLEVLRAMKDHDALKNIPVVMLTSSAEESDLVRSYDMGVNSYVVKPVDFERFAQEISKLGFYWLLINRQPGQ